MEPISFWRLAVSAVSLHSPHHFLGVTICDRSDLDTMTWYKVKGAIGGRGEGYASLGIFEGLRPPFSSSLLFSVVFKDKLQKKSFQPFSFLIENVNISQRYARKRCLWFENKKYLQNAFN